MSNFDPGPRIVTFHKTGTYFGLNLLDQYIEMRHYVSFVHYGTPAEKAGLRGGDCILEVNGVNVVGPWTNHVNELIKQSGDVLKLTVLSISQKTQDPRVVTIHKTGTLFGFYRDFQVSYGRLRLHINGKRYLPLTYVRSATHRNLAEEAGIRIGDHILEVNGVNVEGAGTNVVAGLIQQSGDVLELTVISISQKLNYSDPGIRVITIQKIDNRIGLDFGDFGYIEDFEDSEDSEDWEDFEDSEDSEDFEDFERETCTLKPVLQRINGNLYPPLTYVYLVRHGGPAEKAGIRIGDCILEVNGVNVQGAGRNAVIGLIQQSGDVLELTVLSASLKKAEKLEPSEETSSFSYIDNSEKKSLPISSPYYSYLDYGEECVVRRRLRCNS